MHNGRTLMASLILALSAATLSGCNIGAVSGISDNQSGGSDNLSGNSLKDFNNAGGVWDASF